MLNEDSKAQEGDATMLNIAIKRGQKFFKLFRCFIVVGQRPGGGESYAF